MKRINYIIAALSVALTISSCGIYNKFEQPTEAAELTEDLYKYIEASSAESSLASLSWRELFTDPYLQALIERGLEHNTDLKLTSLTIEQAEAALSASRKAFLPSLSLEPQGSISNYKGTTSKSYNVALSSSWEIDLFGKLRNAKQQSLAALEQSRAYRQAVQTELIATIAGSYYSLLMLDEQLSISEQTERNWEDNLRVMSAMKQAGRINETSVLQSEASSIALRTSMVTLREQIAALESSLSALLTLPTGPIERGKMGDTTFPSDLSVGLPLELLSSRPDVRMAESYLAEMFYATAEARSSFYPSVTLSGAAGFTNSSGAISNPGDMLYTLVGSLVQPLFSRGTLKAQLEISKAQQEQALLLFNQSILDAGSEVNDALSQWQSADERLAFEAQRIDVLQRTVSKTELLMRYGVSTSLDVLTAQLGLLQAELSFAGDKYNLSQGVISLYRALGGGA